ncbi:hypothetical protein [Brevibacillus laterosporus]|uniref:hypothetical protein n=1 Tax=Brevibacillus laterosporus TaxID=1465 RepID=UPI003D238939
MPKPIFCPNCASPLPDISFNLKKFTGLECTDRKGKTVVAAVNGWGVDCDICGWNGEILPTDEDDKMY